MPETDVVREDSDTSCNGKGWRESYKDIKHAAPGVRKVVAESVAPVHAQDRHEINVVLGGAAGQGLQTIAQILTRMFMYGGLHVLAVSEFMSRIRGGSNSITLRAAHTPVRAVKAHTDVCVVLDKKSLERLRGGCAPDTILIGDPVTH